MITRNAVLHFRRDLWKDQRQLDVASENGEPITLTKQYDSHEEAQCEQTVLKHLMQLHGQEWFPEVLDIGPLHTTFRYICGIRIFNLFVELDAAPPDLSEQSTRLKRLMLQRCTEQERAIQNGLYGMPNVRAQQAYSTEKVRSIIHLLAECLGIHLNDRKMAAELDWLSATWSNLATVPFRDATTKNFALASRQLWLGRYKGEEERREYLYESIRNGACEEWLNQPIVDYDFSSCMHNTTPEDDVISLLYHERTWVAPPTSADDLVWDFAPNAVRAAITFLVRYYRFGGRKAAYRLLHPTGHRIRFKHDNDMFYFERLSSIVRRLWPQADSQMEGILYFTDVVAQHLPSAREDTDYFLEIQPKERRNYYIDMYPE